MAIKCPYPECQSQNVVKIDTSLFDKNTFVCQRCGRTFQKTSTGKIIAGALSVAASIVTIIHNGHDPNSGNHGF